MSQADAIEPLLKAVDIKMKLEDAIKIARDDAASMDDPEDVAFYRGMARGMELALGFLREG